MIVPSIKKNFKRKHYSFTNFAKPSLVNIQIITIKWNTINAIETLTIREIPKHIDSSSFLGQSIKWLNIDIKLSPQKQKINRRNENRSDKPM